MYDVTDLQMLRGGGGRGGMFPVTALTLGVCPSTLKSGGAKPPCPPLFRRHRCNG